MKKIWENIKLWLAMIVLGALLLYVGTLILMPEMTVKIFGFQPYQVYTESMEPEIMVNDVVVVGNFDIDAAQPGDIITFYADIDYNGTKEVVTHYIYSIEGEGQDALIRTHRHFEDPSQVTPDTWIISAEDVLGSYQFHIAYLGYLIGFLQSIYGIVIVGVNIIIFTTIKIVNNRQKRKEELEAQEEITSKEIVQAA